MPTRYFTTQYIAAKVGKTGLTVTVDVYRVDNQSQEVTGASAAEIGGGVYTYAYEITDAENNYNFVAIFNTADVTVDQQDIVHYIGYGDLADSVWDEDMSASQHNIRDSAAWTLRKVPSTVIHQDVAQAGTLTTITLDAGASAVDGAYDPAMIILVGGTGAGQCRLILEYRGATRVAVVDRSWKMIPDATTEYQILGHPGREHVNEGSAQGGTSNTITLNPLASSKDNAYRGQVVFIRGGAGEDQAERVLSYNGETKVATMLADWDVIPDATSVYVVLPTATLDVRALSLGIADYVWGEPILEHRATGSVGRCVVDIAPSVWSYVSRSLTEAIVGAEFSIGAKITRAGTLLTGEIVDIYPGTTRRFDVLLTIAGAIQDLTADTLTLMVKRRREDSDAQALLSVDADVVTEGVSGVAKFTLTATHTKAIPPRKYFIGITWIRGNGDEYVVYDDTIRFLSRVNDIGG